MKNHNTKKGFTLIELLVVIAIISLLSSIVIVSLSSAKLKAKDALIKDEVSKYVTLMNLSYTEANGYCDLANNPSAWVSSQAMCDSIPVAGTTYANDAKRLCNSIWENAADLIGSPGQYRMLIYQDPSAYYCSNSSPPRTAAFSITVPLNKGVWYCAGSSGRTSENTSYGGVGCYDNP